MSEVPAMLRNGMTPVMLNARIVKNIVVSSGTYLRASPCRGSPRRC